MTRSLAISILVCLPLTGCGDEPASEDGCDHPPTEAQAKVNSHGWHAQGTWRIDKLEHDFGRIREDRLVKASFRIVNGGSQTRRIIKVESSCGCAVVGLSAKELAPRAAATLDVELDGRGRAGTFKKSVWVSTDDPEAQRINLIIAAKIEGVLAISPRSMAFGLLQPGQAADWKLLKFGSLDPKFEISKADIVGEGFELEEIEAGPDPERDDRFRRVRRHYRIRFAGSPEPGRLMGKATFLTNDKTLPKVDLHLIASIATPIRMLPGLVPLVLQDKKRTHQQTVRLMSARGETFKVTDIDITPLDGVALRVEAVPGNPAAQHVRTYKVIAELPGRGDWKGPQLSETTILFRTDMAKQPEVKLKLRAVARGV